MKLLAYGFLLAALAMVALAADVTGDYSGTFTPEGQDENGAVAHIKQTGNEITGTAGPDEDQQWAISKGKIEGNKITCEVQNPDGPSFKFDLTVDGDRIFGDVSATMPDGQNMRGKLDLKRVKK